MTHYTVTAEVLDKQIQEAWAEELTKIQSLASVLPEELRDIFVSTMETVFFRGFSRGQIAGAKHGASMALASIESDVKQMLGVEL